MSTDPRQRNKRTAQQVLYFVFKTGDAELQQIQQAVDLQHWQIRHPALQESCICILQHPQEAHQQSPATLCWQRAGLAGRLAKTNTHTMLPLQCLTWKNSLERGQRATYRQQQAVTLEGRWAMWKECTYLCFFIGVTERPVWCSVKLRQQSPTQSGICDLSL